MTNKPPITQVLTQAAQTILARVNLHAFNLKAGAKVPEIRLQDASMDKPDVYPLLGDRYVIGRSSKNCDILVRNPVVSQVHFSIERDSKKPDYFIVKDENSTNGIYLGKRRINSLSLRHGDVITLGPPELAAAVTVKYHSPPPLLIQLIRYCLYAIATALTLFCLLIGFSWIGVTVDPLPDGIIAPVVVYAGDGQTSLNPVRKDTHKEIESLSEFGQYLPNAVIASEDSRFYWHLGVDPLGVLRAFLINYQEKEIRQGASTITQQLARSLFAEVGRQNTFGRKVREMLVALKLEAIYSKNELLRTYLNRVYLGVTSYGFEDAAQFFFDKSVKDLNLAEAATLVGMLPAPNSYNPIQNYNASVEFRNRVISRMAEAGMVSKEEADKARRSRIEVSPKARDALSNIIAPYFYSYVFEELRSLLGEELAKEGNFIVETGLDIKLQKQAELALRNQVTTNGSTFGFSEGAIVTLNSSTGEILALSGGVDYKKSQFNRVTSAQRQPGSTFKVFTYTAAIEDGISPDQEYSCEPLSWKGQRFKGCERSSGQINMYTALALSENSVALRIGQQEGLEKVKETAERMGINSPLNAVPGLVLGQSEVNLLEITGAYGTLANRGVWSRPHAINRILDGGDCTDYNDLQTCREIFSFEKEQNIRKRAISENVANRMTELLQGVIENGTGRAAALGVGEAGKTGTTNNYVDLWFIGYIPEKKLVTGVWLGNDNNTPTKGSSGQAAMIWGKYMKNVTSTSSKNNG